jgi:hypothetical protein
MDNHNTQYPKLLVDYDTDEIAVMLTNMPHPQISPRARLQISNHLQQSLPTLVAKRSRIIRFPVQASLQLTASLAIFILILYQLAIPTATKTEVIEKLYPIQRVEELHEVELFSFNLS